MKTKIPSWNYKVENCDGFTDYLMFTKQLKEVFVDFKHLYHLIELKLKGRHERVIYK